MASENSIILNTMGIFTVEFIDPISMVSEFEKKLLNG